MYFKTVTEWGGGYPRPGVEMMECKWAADTPENPNPHPATFIMMKPDLSLAENLYEKQQADLEKRKNMFKDVSEFDQKRRALEMNKMMLKFALKK